MNIYPPGVPEEELVDCHGYENLDRIVVTGKNVYGRLKGNPDGAWIVLVKPSSIAESWPYHIRHYNK